MSDSERPDITLFFGKRAKEKRKRRSSMRKINVSIRPPSDKGKEEEVIDWEDDPMEEEEEEPRGLPSVSDAFSEFDQPPPKEVFKSFPDAEHEWGSGIVKKIVIQDRPPPPSSASPQRWSCESCDQRFPKVRLLWAHLDICAMKKTSDSAFRSLPPVPKFVVYKPVERRVVVIGEDEEGGVEIGERWEDHAEGVPEGLFTPQGFDRFNADTYVPRQDGGGSLMTEEEQMKWAMEASVNGSVAHFGMSEEEQWALQRSASIEHAGDAQIRAMELDKEMDDMQVAMAASVMGLPMHEYYMGKEAYELSCIECQIAPHGVIMAPEVLVLLHQRGYFNRTCPKCRVTKNPWTCMHFLPYDFAHLMKMRRVCKQWMVCIDNWMKRTGIMKSAANCVRCHVLHFKIPDGFPLPRFVQAAWCNIDIKLSNDYVIETEWFPCHYSPHNPDKELWDPFYH